MLPPMNTRLFSLALLAVGVISHTAFAGPTWPEGPEAGALPGTSQHVNTAGPVAMIFGTLGGPSPAPISARGITGDFQDMYLIKIVDPIIFMASTDPNFGGFSDFDTQLFLFTGPDHPDGPGLGMFANDESPGAAGGESRIDNNVNDGSFPPTLTANVHYFLAISGFDSDPGSVDGAIFNQANALERSGPDGLGGLAQINGWLNNGDFGDYVIALAGVEAQTLCPYSDFNNDGITDTADLGILLAQFGAPGGGPTDLNFDGVVDTADLGILLDSFGVICP